MAGDQLQRDSTHATFATGTKLLGMKSEVYGPITISNISELYCGSVGVDTN